MPIRSTTSPMCARSTRFICADRRSTARACDPNGRRNGARRGSFRSQRQTMSLNPETLREIDSLVRGGFEERDRVIEIMCEEMYAPGELDEAEVIAAVDAAFTSLARAKTTWPATTDCDRLDSAFTALNARGIIALQNAGYTQSDGYDDVRESYHERSDRDGV